MLFQSPAFIFAFLPLVLITFRALLALGLGNLAGLMLAVSSIFFYGWYRVEYVAIILGSVVFNFMMGRFLVRHPRRAWLAAGIAVNIGLLGFYKYATFIADNLQAATGWRLDVPVIVLPLAISFFTFQQIAYLVDLSTGRNARHGFVEYALFVTFFPQLIAGPIVHHAEVMPQFRRIFESCSRSVADLGIGGTIFVLGLAKKLLLADTFGLYADSMFDAVAAGDSPSFVDAWFGVIAYSMQIYFDFSGYSDMAVGLGRMFGVRLPVNFFSPYRATSIIEFWRRWHMSLSRFLRDYLYIPLGGNRLGEARRAANVMIVMLLG